MCPKTAQVNKLNHKFARANYQFNKIQIVKYQRFQSQVSYKNSNRANTHSKVAYSKLIIEFKNMFKSNKSRESKSKDTKSKESKTPTTKRLTTPSLAAPSVTRTTDKLNVQLGKPSDKKPIQLLSGISKRNEYPRPGFSQSKGSGKGLFGGVPKPGALSMSTATSSRAYSSTQSYRQKIKPDHSKPIASSSRTPGSNNSSIRSIKFGSPASSIASSSGSRNSQGSSIKSAKSDSYSNPAAGLSRGGGERGFLFVTNTDKNPRNLPNIMKQEPSPPSDDETKTRLRKEKMVIQQRGTKPPASAPQQDSTRLRVPKKELKIKKVDRVKPVAVERKVKADKLTHKYQLGDDPEMDKLLDGDMAEFDRFMEREADEERHFQGLPQVKGKGKA